jgi:EmrB/QacA subfamily drug resistance transporter
VAQFMLILDVTVVNVALPDIGADLHLHRATLTWVITAYTLAFGGLMLLGGRAADLFGARRTLLVGLAVFTAASLTAGLAGDAPLLLGARAAQGVGAALLSPAALSIVTTTFHGPERGKALGIWAALGGTGSAVGVLLGGVLTAGPGWQWIFFLNVPVGLAVLLALPAVVPARSAPARGRVDVPGALLVTAATGATIYALINAGDHGWGASSTLLPLAVAVVLYAGFAVLERTLHHPLMDLRLLARRPVAAGALLILVATGLLIAGFFLGSFYLQHRAGYDALTTGLLFLPVAVATILGAQAASRAIGHLGGRTVAAAALTLAAAGVATAAAWPGVTGLVIGIAAAAAGLGATFVTATTTALAHVEPHQAGLASGIVNTFHELGGALGVAAVSGVAAASLTGTGTAGFTHAFTVAALAALASVVLAVLLVPAGKPPAGLAPHAH